MTYRLLPVTTLTEVLRAGLVVDRLEAGVGSFFTLYFRPRILGGQSYTTYGSSVWVYFCDWFFFKGDEVLSTHHEAQACILDQDRVLRGKELTALGVPEDDDEVFEFRFEGDRSLQVSCYSGDRNGGEELLLVFDKGKHLVSLMPEDLGCPP